MDTEGNPRGWNRGRPPEAPIQVYLSFREKQILTMKAEGWSDKQISMGLVVVKEQSVKSYVKRGRKKLEKRGLECRSIVALRRLIERNQLR